MPFVELKENESFEIALRRFKRSCERAGIISRVREKEFYEKPTWERKRKRVAIEQKNMKKIRREKNKFRRLY